MGVTSESISELLRLNQPAESIIFTQGKPVRVELSVEKDFPIALNSERAGRVFELSGQSDRNKTTSLIYMATLLGINWEEARPFLDRDGKVYDIATKKVCLALSHGQKAEMWLTSESYKLSISIVDSRAMIVLHNEKGRPVTDFESKTIPLTSSEDWQNYRQLMELICDVQFVSKSRDFIGQVAIEESKDLGWFCETVADRAGRLLRSLRNLPRDQVYGRTQKDLAIEISSLTTRLKEVKKEIDELNQNIETLKQLIQYCQRLLSMYRELEDNRDPEVREVLNYLKLEEMARGQDRRRRDLEQSIQALELELKRAQQQLSQQEPPFTAIRGCLEALRGRIVSELKNLSVLSSDASQVLREIANKNYDPLLAFCSYAQVSNETISLLESILKATEPFSKGLVIPLESAIGPGIKLLDLEKDLSVASSRAMDIQRLNPELTAAYEAFQDAHILSVLEFRRRESDVDTARAIVREKERMLEERRTELKVINETIHSLLGQEDFKSLKARGDQLRQSLPNDNKEMLERVEQLANHIGYNYPWQFNLSELQAMIREWYAKTQELEGAKTDKEKVELQLNERLSDLRKSSLREDTGPSQLDALRELQRILQLIDNYLQEFRRRRERGLEAARLYSSSQIDQLKEQLSAYEYA